jgi:hypothetical protein
MFKRKFNKKTIRLITFFKFLFFISSFISSKLDILSLLTNKTPLNFQDWLQYNLFKNIRSIYIKDTFSFPILDISKLNSKENKFDFEFNLFYSTIQNGTFLTNSSTIITNCFSAGDLIQNNNDIFDISTSFPELSTTNFPIIGSLFNNFYIKQHKIGGILNAEINFEKFYIFLKVPIEYQINFPFVDNETQDKIASELPGLSEEKNGQELDITKYFLKEHCVTDFFGIDRPKIGFKIENIKNNIDTEIFFLIPIGIEFKDGIIGGKFQNTEKPNFKLSNYIYTELESKDKNLKEYYQEEFFNLFANILDNLTCSLYRKPFSEKPLASGINFILHFPIFYKEKDEILYNIKAQIQNSYEKKLYGYIKTNSSAFKLDYSTLDEKVADNIINFLNDQLLKRILLRQFNAQISPSLELENNISININTNKINSFFGINFWFKTAENVSVNFFNNDFCDLSSKENFFFTQQNNTATLSTFLGFSYDNLLKNTPISIQLSTQIPIYSFNIGKELTFSAKISIEF